MSHQRLWSLLLISLAVAGTAAAGDGTESRSPYGIDQPTASGGLAWLPADDLDLIADFRADVPLFARRANAVYLSARAVTAIRRATSNFRFDVRDVEYVVEVGARDYLTANTLLSVFAGQWGRENVDRDGQPFARYMGFGLESEGFRRYQPDRLLEWRVAGGVVLEDRELEADYLLRGGVRWGRPLGSFTVGADLTTDMLVDGTKVDTDVAVGPRIGLFWPGRRRISLFLHYVNGGTPLGLRVSGLLLGFDVAEGVGAPGIRPRPPDVRGVVSAGAGDARAAGRFRLAVASPPFGPELSVVADVDVNALTSDAPGELYYLYHVGVETPRGPGVVGAYWYHRSNHLLAEPNDRVTSINVLEAGMETPGWDRPPGYEMPGGVGRLEARVRVGWLVQSSFGYRRRVHGLVGFRWVFPSPGANLVPFLQADGEAGEVDRVSLAVGVALTESFDVRLEYLRDDQFFGEDHSAFLVRGSLGF